MLAHLDLVAGTVASLGILAGLCTGAYKIVARITRVHDVILGTDKTPGVGDRLDVLEVRTQQLMPNGGGSIKDDVKVVRTQITDLSRKQEEDRQVNAELRGSQAEQLRMVQHDINNVRATTALLTDLVRQTILNQTTFRQQGTHAVRDESAVGGQAQQEEPGLPG